MRHFGGRIVLALKLLLVPVFLLLLSVVARRWGPSLGGWLAGLPFVAGPTLFFIAMEQGADFGAAALLAVSAVVCFNLVYAHAAQHLRWPFALAVAVLAWAAGISCLSLLPAIPSFALLSALATLLVAPRLFPNIAVAKARHVMSNFEVVCRMLAGALVTVTVTWAAGIVGEVWSGLFAVYPTLGTVLAVFSHRSHGGAYVAALFRAMMTGMYSFVAFCFALAVALPQLGIAWSFIVAVVLSLTVQLCSVRYLKRAVASPLLAR
jgi:hypothetical protein